jgi:DNA-binding NarL/FixJ family response regulator
MCILAHGDGDGLHAAHSCGRRACVNPNHIRWATPAENTADKRIHGTHSIGEQNPMAKLSNAQVCEVRALAANGRKHTEIAKEFGMSNSTISQIVKGHLHREAAIMAMKNVSAG